MAPRDAAAPPQRDPRGLSAAKRWTLAVAVLLVIVVTALAGVAYATYGYSQEYEGKILPGAVVAGVDVSGMTPRRAVKAIKNTMRRQLHRKITISWRGKRWTVTPHELGARSNARAMVKKAVAASSDVSFVSLARMRLLGSELDFNRRVAVSHPRKGAGRFIESIASDLHRDAVNAQLDYSTGWVQITPSRNGRSVLVEDSTKALNKALRRNRDKAQLTVEIEPAEVTADAYDQVLLLRNGENKLYLYQDGEITHSYTVAAGLPEYPTPEGLFEVTEKRYLPTWVNPDPDGWGKDLPKEIGPGPDNPLGLRALNWSAPAIRFHGTSATYSLGYNASHGCVRLSNPDAIELYDLVDVGTPIVSMVVSPLKPLRVSAPDPTIVPGDESQDETEDA
jgi:lipoprotein-anchoring transpeptidase ErfK/SrfK